jgi:dihydroorotase
MLLYSQVHGEVTNPDVDIFDREKVFIETVLEPLVQRLPQLKVVMEHITTMDAVRFIESSKEGTFNRFHYHAFAIRLHFLLFHF